MKKILVKKAHLPPLPAFFGGLELAGEIDVGDGIAMTGFGGNVWWSGSVTGVALDSKGNLRTSIAFSGDCTTWEGELKAKAYGKAQITKGRGGKPDTVKRGWVVLGGAKPVRVGAVAVID